MKQPLSFPRKPLALAMAIATGATPMIASAAAAGRVEFAYGQVSLQDADGEQKTVKKGTKVDSGDTIMTERGRAQLRFSDGAFVSLRPKSSFKVEDYNYESEDDGSERGFFNLFRGGLRAITGAIGKRNRNAYRVKTPVATIGIRGTEWTGWPLGDSFLVGCQKDALDLLENGQVVDEGQYFLINPDGTAVELTFVEFMDLLDQVEDEETPRLESDEQPITEQEVAEAIEAVTGEEEEVDIIFTGELPNAAVAYGFCYDGCEGSGGSGINDVDFPVTANIVEDGLTGWASDPADRGDLDIVEKNVDGIIGWARWAVDGAEGGTFDPPLVGEEETFFNQGESLHGVYGQPTDLASLGVAPHNGRYSLIGNTTPTDDNGAMGTFNGATFEVNFAAQNVKGSADFTFAVPYRITFFGDPGGASDGTFKIGGVVSSQGGCGGSVGCSGSVAGLIAGAAAERGGFVFYVNDQLYMSQEYFGSAVFQANPGGPAAIQSPLP